MIVQTQHSPQVHSQAQLNQCWQFVDSQAFGVLLAVSNTQVAVVHFVRHESVIVFVVPSHWQSVSNNAVFVVSDANHLHDPFQQFTTVSIQGAVEIYPVDGDLTTVPIPVSVVEQINHEAVKTAERIGVFTPVSLVASGEIGEIKISDVTVPTQVG